MADQHTPSPTAGMNLAQRIRHVGGTVTDDLRVSFGSVMAVDALIQQVLRDSMPASCERLRTGTCGCTAYCGAYLQVQQTGGAAHG